MSYYAVLHRYVVLKYVRSFNNDKAFASMELKSLESCNYIYNCLRITSTLHTEIIDTSWQCSRCRIRSTHNFNWSDCKGIAETTWYKHAQTKMTLLINHQLAKRKEMFSWNENCVLHILINCSFQLKSRLHRHG